MSITTIFLMYLIIMNLIAFFIMGIDKYKARNNQWRIAEKTLFLVAILGGSFGMRVGMEFFHHKTRHKAFTIGIPIIFLLQVSIVFLFVKFMLPSS